MQTTLRFEDRLLRDAKAAAAQEGLSLTKFIETTLRRHLYTKPPTSTGRPRRTRLPVSKAKGGWNPAFKTWASVKSFLAAEQLTEDLRKYGLTPPSA